MSIALVIDARGDRIVQETGFDKRWPAKEIFNGGGGHGILINNTGGNPDEAAGSLDTPDTAGIIGLWNPPLSEWFLPQPRQFEPDWTSSSAFPYHVVGKENWNFATDVHETFALGTPETSAPNDKWMQFVTPASPPPLSSVNFAAIAAAVGRSSLPASMVVAAATKQDIPGQITPYFKWIRYPDPQDVLIFGFGDFAFYSDSRFSFLLQNTDYPSHQKWRIVWGQNGSIVWSFEQNSTIPPLSWVVHPQGMMVIPVGLTDLYLMRDSKSFPFIARTRSDPALTSGQTSLQVKTGPWWVACAGSQKVVFQTQTVAYGYAQHWPVISGGEAGNPNRLREEAEWFNLGQEYTPTTDGGHDQTPILNARFLIHKAAGDTVTEPPLSAGINVNNTTDGQSFTVQLLDEEAQPWVSDGTHFRGTMRIQIQPNTSGGAALFGQDCWSPQIKELYCKIPPKLIDRPYTELVLFDQVRFTPGAKRPGGFKPDWECSWSLREPRSKRVRFDLTTYGAGMMAASGLADKHDYSIAVVDPPDATYDALGNVLFPGSIAWDEPSQRYTGEILRAWVTEPPNFGELAQLPTWTTATPEPIDFPPPIGGSNNPYPVFIGLRPIYEAELHARGMMERADEPWLFMSLIQAPLNQGLLLHTEAIKTAFQQSGIDPIFPSAIFVGSDTDPSIMQILPGYAAAKFGEAGVSQNEGYAPDWDEGKLEYAWRVATEWKKWLLYEERSGRIVYKADPLDQIYKNIITDALTPVATFYRTKLSALNYGQNPNQVYHTASQLSTQPVKHNVVRVIPALGTLPQVVIQDGRGCLQPNPLGGWTPGFGDPTYENYVGFKVRPAVIHPKMGNDLSPLQQIAVMGLLRWRRRIITRTWSCDLRPDQIGTLPGPTLGFPIELGDTVGLEDGVPGTPTKYQVVKLSMKQMGRGKFRTTITGEILPTPPNVGGL